MISLEVGKVYRSRDGYTWMIYRESSSMDISGQDMFFGAPIKLPYKNTIFAKFEWFRFWANGVSVDYPNSIFDLIAEEKPDGCVNGSNE